MKLVLDSSNRNPITAAELHLSGAVALIAKATEGTSFKDGTLDGQRRVARTEKKPFGSYLFLQPNSRGSEAAYYLDYARPRRGDIQPVVDAEVTSMGIADLAHRTLTCATALEANGYDPIVYASASIWKQMVAVQPKLKKWRVWEADYPGRFTRWAPRFAKLRIRLTRGARVVLWQWTDNYAVGSRHFDASALLVPLGSLLIPASGTAGLAGGKEVAL